MSKKLIRSKFRSVVFARDKNLCVLCKSPAVDAHHITDRYLMPNGGYVLENGISLCAVCHKRAEEYHRTKGWCLPGYYPDDLYHKIGSSLELAHIKSKELL